MVTFTREISWTKTNFPIGLIASMLKSCEHMRRLSRVSASALFSRGDDSSNYCQADRAFLRPASNKATPVPAATCLTPPPSSYPTLLPCHRMVETRTSAIASGVSSTTTAAPTRSAVVLTKRLAGELAQVGLSLEVGTELNFYLFEESPTVARQQKWRNLTPVTASPINHSIRNSRLSADFMMQARKRLDFRSIEWDG